MKYLKLIFTLVFAMQFALVQSQDLKWAGDFGSHDQNYVNSLITKVAGNGDYIVTGILYGTVDFDFSSGVKNLTSDRKNVFIARYSSTGSFIWVKLLKGTRGFYESSNPTINIDKDDNIILGMRSDHTVDFDPSDAGEYKLQSAYNDTEAAYLAKYDGNGNFIWAKKFQADRGLYPNFIETDAVDGSIYLVGGYYYTQDFDFGSGITSLYGSSQTNTIFLAKYNPTGDLIFAKILMSTNDGVGITAMKMINNSEFVFAGNLIGANFNPGGTAAYFYVGTNGGYVAKYKTDGTFICANAIYIENYIGDISDVTTDRDGNMYVVGDFSGSVDFNGRTTEGQVIVAKSSYETDGFVVKYNAQAEVVWYFSIGNTDWDSCNGIEIDSKNNLLIVGLFTGEVDFDPLLSSYQTLVNPAGASVYAASYTLDKQYINAKQLAFSPSNMVMSPGMIIKASDDFMIGAIAYNPTDVDPSSNEVLVHTFPSDSGPREYLSVYNLNTTPITTSILNQQTTSFTAYPNPVTGDVLYITNVPEDILNSRPVLTSLDGRTISLAYTQDQEKLTIDLNGLAKGVYFITMDGHSVKIIR